MDENSSASSANPSAADVAIAFVKAVEAGRDPAAFVTRDVVEEEMPNRVFANGAIRDLSAMSAGVERGKDLFRKQQYVFRRTLEDGDVAVLELEWTGVLAKQLGSLPDGGTMRAQAAFFFEVREGRIARIRHYDCFDPF